MKPLSRSGVAPHLPPSDGACEVVQTFLFPLQFGCLDFPVWNGYFTLCGFQSKAAAMLKSPCFTNWRTMFMLDKFCQRRRENSWNTEAVKPREYRASDRFVYCISFLFISLPPSHQLRQPAVKPNHRSQSVSSLSATSLPCPGSLMYPETVEGKPGASQVCSHTFTPHVVLRVQNWRKGKCGPMV